MPEKRFISDAEMAQRQPKRFISDADMDRLEIRQAETAIGESAIRGAAQGATMGFADEITGAIESAVDYAKGSGNLLGTYERRRNESRALYDKASRDNPLTYRTGDIVGTIGSTLIPGVGFLAPVKGAKTLANAGRAALGGAISGAGTSEAQNLADLVADTAIGGALGFTLGAVIDKGGKSLQSLRPDNLRKSANERAVKSAIGRNQKLMEQMSNVKAPDTGEVALESAGRRLRESGIMGPLSRAEGMAAGVTAAKNDAGAKIGLTLKTLDDAMPNAVSGKKIADELLDLAAKLPDSEISDGTVKRLLSEAERFEKMGNIPFAKAQQYKDLWRFDPKLSEHASLGKKTMNKVNRLISNNMDETADEIGRMAGEGSPIAILADAYRKNRGDYQAFINLETGIKKNVPRNISNRFTSPSDYATGAAGLGYGLTQGAAPSLGVAAPFALAAAALNHQIRMRGNSFAAMTAGKLANILEKTPNAVGRFSNTLLKASELSPNALWITHQLLLKDPDYQDTLGIAQNSSLIPRR